MRGDGGCEGVLHEPVDLCLWESASKTNKNRDRAADIAERARTDQEDAIGLGRWLRVSVWHFVRVVRVLC